MTLTIVIDADFRSFVEQDAADNSYEPADFIRAYCAALEQSVAELVDGDLDVDVRQIDAGGCTPLDSLTDEGGETLMEDVLPALAERAYQAAGDAVSAGHRGCSRIDGEWS